MMLTKFLLSLALVSQVARPEFNPDLHWKTLKTEHFWIHHIDSMQESAQDLAVRAETMFKIKAERFKYVPSYPIHVVLSDHTDTPNGISTPLPYNTIFLYGVPPLDESSLDEYDDWLNTLLTHELTHTFHLDMAEGFNKIPRAIVGRIWVPNAVQQQWSHEGLAITYETNETTRGRGRSSFLQMFLRTVSLENSFIGIERATYYNDEYPFGNSAYWYGIGFHQFLEQKYGKDIMIQFAHETASHPIPSIMNFKTDKIFGKSFHRLWEEWKQEEHKKWSEFQATTKSKFVSSSPEQKKWRLVGLPTWDPQGKRFFASVRDDDQIEIREFTKESDGKFSAKTIAPDVGALRLSYFDEHLLYSDVKPNDPYSSYFDLHVYDLKAKKSHRITHGLRLRDPIVYKDYVYAIRTNEFKSQIVRIPWSLVIEAKIKKKRIMASKSLEIVFEASGLDTISKPIGNPSRNELIFSMKRTNKNRDLYALDLDTQKLEQLTDDLANDHHPQISSDGKMILYSSDQLLPGTNERVPNIVALSRESGEKRLVSDAITGVTFPAFFGDEIVAGVFHSKGYELQTFKWNWDQADPLPRDPTTQDETPRSFESGSTYTSTQYSFGSTLLPRYLAPILLYTETDTFLGAQTASYDPLGRHTWIAGAYHRLEPNRPGGFASYVYNGWRPSTLYLAFSTGLTDYGRIIFQSEDAVYNQKYFERSYMGTIGASSKLWTPDGPTDFTLGIALFFEDRRSEFNLPSDSLSGVGTFLGQENVRLSAETGQTIGGRLNVKWSSGISSGYKAFSPSSGSSLGLSVEYAPRFWISDFQTLSTLLTGKTFYSPWLKHVIAFSGALGYQWLDVFYQHTFLLGGSLGEGPFTSANRQSYSLRGLPGSNLRGEGIIVGSLEYRLPLFTRVPGFGTAPLWLKNIHFAVFGDGGQTFTQFQDRRMAYEFFSGQARKRGFGLDRFTVSTGAELRSDISLFYAPPLTFRAGYGQVLVYRGDWYGDRDINEFYVQAGTSF